MTRQQPSPEASLQIARRDEPAATTIYCGKQHSLVDGRPVEHRCRLLPLAFMRAEAAGDLDTAFRVLLTEPLIMAGPKPPGARTSADLDGASQAQQPFTGADDGNAP